MKEIQKNSSQFPVKVDSSGLFTKAYADICFLFSADVNEDRAIMMGNFLNQYYSSKITPSEFSVAFEMYITDKLDDHLVADNKGNIDKTTYNRIDPALIAKVIKAFLQFKKANIPKEEIKALPRSRQESIDLENHSIDDIVRCYDNYFKTGEIVIGAVQVIVIGLKKCDLFVEKEITDKMLEKEANRLKFSTSEKNVRTILKAGINHENGLLVNSVYNLQMTESVKASFDMINFNELDLRYELDLRRVYKLK